MGAGIVGRLLAAGHDVIGWNRTRARAEELIRRSDRDRARYIRYLFNIDWADPTPYDLIINTRSLTTAAAVERRARPSRGSWSDRAWAARLVPCQAYIFTPAGQTSHMDSMADPHTDLASNAAAQLQVLEACRRHNPGVKVVFTSTRQIYGRPQYLPVDERHPVRPVDINGVHKFAGEGYHLLYHAVYGVRASILRLTNTYGPGMRIRDARQNFLGIWIRYLVEKQPIPVFGGQQVRDFNFVDDVVEALLLAATRPEADGQVFNLGAPDSATLEQLAALLVEMTPGASYQVVPFPPERQAIEIGVYRSDFSLIQRTLGWSPQVPLRAGLRRTLDYYVQNFRDYVE